MQKIEREWKFLVTECPAKITAPGKRIEQAYLSTGLLTIRSRVYGGQGFLTIKSPRSTANDGAAQRLEFEYEIPVDEAREMIRLTERKIIKTRYVYEDGLELDIFEDEFQGIIVAELEQDEGSEPPPPAGFKWINVSLDPAWTNRSMIVNGLPDDAVIAKRI